MMPPSRLDCPLNLKTPNMGNTGLCNRLRLLFNREFPYGQSPSSKGNPNEIVVPITPRVAYEQVVRFHNHPIFEFSSGRPPTCGLPLL